MKRDFFAYKCNHWNTSMSLDCAWLLLNNQQLCLSLKSIVHTAIFVQNESDLMFSEDMSLVNPDHGTTVITISD